jgi:D-aspartate ligase
MTRTDLAVLIPDGETPHALKVTQCLAAVPGVAVYVLSSDPWALPRFSRHKRLFATHVRAERDIDWVESVLHCVDQWGIDVVCPVDEEAIRALSMHGRVLPAKVSITPLPTTDAFDTAADKGLMAEFMLRNNLPTPPTILFQPQEAVESVLSRLTLPVLTKPRKAGGGEGIEYWEDKNALREYLAARGRTDDLIVQAHINGHTIDCSALCRDGEILAYTIQEALLPSPPQFAPSDCVRFIHNSEVYEITQRLVTALRWSGVAHIDLMFDEQDKTYKILEANPRYWGTVLWSLKVGVNFPYLACLAALHVDFPRPEFSSVPFSTVGALIGMLRRGRGQSAAPKVGISNTNIKYILGDPIPPLVRLARKTRL